ncbi:MAG: hypothetical protein AB7F40_04905 [Victivallaceae bacterium]
MKDRPRVPGLLVMFGAMLLILGGLASYIGWRQSPGRQSVAGLEAISTGGDSIATEKFEQAVNRYLESSPPLSTHDESSERIAAYLKANAPVCGLLDQVTAAKRISFRRNWNRGFEVERLGVVDIHNLAKLNYYRMLASGDPADIRRLAASIRTLAGYLEFDPMMASATVYAPTYQLYLVALKYALAHAGYSPAERAALAAELADDAVRSRRIFVVALRNESKMLEDFPQTLDRNYSASDVATTAAGLSRLALLLETDNPANAAELKEWKAPDNPVAERMINGRGYAELLENLLSAIEAGRRELAEPVGR